jgi:tRNA threonylcarbamoyladenosine biosynthesis protein TsaB
VLLLALDTSDSRGSIALLRDQQILQTIAHDTGEDYSCWVLPAVDRLLASSQRKLRDVDVYAVAAGPGSFTGLRVGLTSVKAWSEVYGGKIAAVSRLEAIASHAPGHTPYIAAFVDAQRDQVFGGLFRREGQALHPVEQEMVIAPEGFLQWVEERTAGRPISWISMDPQKLSMLPGWTTHANAGATIHTSPLLLAPAIGKLGLQRAQSGRVIDALTLDAQYVRRSDAEIFWKGHAPR